MLNIPKLRELLKKYRGKSSRVAFMFIQGIWKEKRKDSRWDKRESRKKLTIREKGNSENLTLLQWNKWRGFLGLKESRNF